MPLKVGSRPFLAISKKTPRKKSRASTASRLPTVARRPFTSDLHHLVLSGFEAQYAVFSSHVSNAQGFQVYCHLAGTGMLESEVLQTRQLLDRKRLILTLRTTQPVYSRARRQLFNPHIILGYALRGIVGRCRTTESSTLFGTIPLLYRTLLHTKKGYVSRSVLSWLGILKYPGYAIPRCKASVACSSSPRAALDRSIRSLWFRNVSKGWHSLL